MTTSAQHDDVVSGAGGVAPGQGHCELRRSPRFILSAALLIVGLSFVLLAALDWMTYTTFVLVGVGPE